MFEKGKLIPDGEITALGGARCRLWDFRQKSHLLLVSDPAAPEERLRRQALTADHHRKTWEWLGVKVIVTGDAPPEFGAGLFAIDRFGGLIAVYPLEEDAWARVTNEFLYYEARHC